ncbi:MAG: hypothetical protein ABJF23_24210 [Bryobacteraceae bacterium]
MKSKSWIWGVTIAACLAASAWAGTFGKVVAIGGHASDLALDEGRGVLYIANFTANRIDVMSLADNTVQRSINVPSQPSSLSVSPDGKYLVITHFGNAEAGQSSRNGLTVINLESSAKQTFALGSAPLGVAFGIDNLAFIATATDFTLFDPVLGTMRTLDTLSGLKIKTIPQPAASFPPNITQASIAASRDGLWIYGSTDQLDFRYDVTAKHVEPSFYTSSPPSGPRTVSVNADGTAYVTGWTLNNRTFDLISEFPSAAGTFNIGSQSIDSSRNLIYAEIPTSTDPLGANQKAILQVVDSDNLAVRERLQLAEHLAGKSVLSNDSNTLYSISDSGVTVFPVGNLSRERRVTVSQEDVVFRGSFCDRQAASQEITLLDQSGLNTDFSLTNIPAGVRVSPTSGTTPARIRISVDPAGFQNSRGSTVANITVNSTRAINLPTSIRVVVNTRQPDQRGTFVNIPGTLVDILPDPSRARFYILRQDKNQVLVFDSNSNTQIATLRTGNIPTQMAITFDRRYLLVGSNDSQLLYVFDLETLQATPPVRMPGGHYPKSVASSAGAILVANRVAGPLHTIDKVDLNTRTATQLPSLGVYKNDININTALVASANGSSILAAEADGNMLLYNSNADTFTISRKDTTSLSGAYAASSFDQYMVGNTLLNSSLVAVRQLETGTGLSSGFAFVDQGGLRITAPNAAAPGIIQKVDLQSGTGSGVTRVIEAPLLSDSTGTLPFTRTLAPLANRTAIIALTTSGFTVLPWNYDAAVAPPTIDRVVNAADFSQPIAPGGLITVFGTNLSPISQSTTSGSLPTALADSCLQVNGLGVPVLFVSPTQINGQLPNFDGNTTLTVYTPGGVSDNFNLTILPAAPSVFRISSVGPDGTNAAILRSSNNQLVTPSNPIHRTDTIVIYATGLGRTSPEVPPGTPAPTDELAGVIIPPVITVGGVPVSVEFAGLTPGQIGVYQINVRMNSRIPLGLSVPLVISQGAGSTSLQVRVVE